MQLIFEIAMADIRDKLVKNDKLPELSQRCSQDSHLSQFLELVEEVWHQTNLQLSNVQTYTVCMKFSSVVYKNISVNKWYIKVSQVRFILQISSSELVLFTVLFLFFVFFLKKLLALFNGWDSTASKLQSHYEEALHFLPLS